MTERLYETDSYCASFDAQVLACMAEDGRYAVTLDRTAFFPEGGGQPGDVGTLGGARVLDTQLRGGDPVHLCDRPLSGAVHGELDFDRRFTLMQQHSGEHIFSGVVHSVCGWNNVGFHMGETAVTVDFDGRITPEELLRIEKLANEAIYRNLPIEILCPSPDEAERYSYRSKKEVEGQLRLTRIPGVDLCACCGTHVARTGEVGIIKVTDCMNYKGGVRVTLQIGRRALADYREKNAQTAAVSALLCAKPYEIAAAVEKLQEKNKALDFALGGVKRQLFAALCADAGGETACRFYPGGSAEDARQLADALAEHVTLAAAFAGADGDYKYALASRTADVRAVAKALNAACGGRGGGKPQLAQGAVTATKETITAFFADRKEETA
ncbi:MAG: hypothetical protein IJK64_04970 [Clostridia bacterium]|nr:hypothetical protein [Clostridia bacterium]